MDITIFSGGRGTFSSLGLFYGVRKPFSEAPSKLSLMSPLPELSDPVHYTTDCQCEGTTPLVWKLSSGQGSPLAEGFGNGQECSWFTK